jgi:hypothetical protein
MHYELWASPCFKLIKLQILALVLYTVLELYLPPSNFEGPAVLPRYQVLDLNSQFWCACNIRHVIHVVEL